MNLILLFPEDFMSGNHVRLMDYRAEHIRTIHRGYKGQVLKVGVVNGDIGEGRILDIQKKHVDLQVKINSQPSPALINISLILALPRPQTLKKVLENISTFGVKKLFLIDTARVEKSFFSSKLLKDQGWMKHIRLGLEQGGRTQIPEVTVHSSFTKFFQEDVRQIQRSDTLKLIAHPNSPSTALDMKIPKGINILCALGPEGGWLDSEVKHFVSHGFQKISLGPTLHRVENAVCAFLAQMELLTVPPKKNHL